MCICLASGFASAQSSNKAAAEALFAEGKRLMAAGQFVDACPKFADSQAADPAVGTQLNLARCYKEVGLTASAWSEYKSAAAAARAAGQSAREQLARNEAKAIEAQLNYVLLSFPEEAKVEGVEVRIDGAVIPASLLNMRMPVDPGEHRVRVTAPGYVEWEESFSVEDAETSLAIPSLEPAASETPLQTTGSSAEAAGSNRTLAWVGFGVGAAGIVTGVIGLLGSSSAQGKLDDVCPTEKSCPTTDENQQYIDDDSFYKTLSVVGFIVGGVGVAAGATFLLIPGAEAEQPAQLEAFVAPGGGGLRGAF